MMLRSSLGVLACVLAAGCSNPQPTPVAQPGEAPAVAPVTVETIPAPSASTAPAASAAPKPALEEAAKPVPAPVPAPAVTYKGAFAHPESVFYDAAGDRYLVSNINGNPDGVDNNGYISELLPDGTIKTPKLIAGGEKGVKLDAPKGLIIVGKELWVSDITVVRKFDLKTLASKGDIALPDATFANDIALAPDGKVYVSDSSVKPGPKGFEPQGGDQVLVIDKTGKAKTLAKSKDLGAPNGLAFGPKGLLVNTLTSNEVYGFGPKGEKVDVVKMPSGMLDGLLVVGDNLVCSSWAGSAIYKGKLGGTSYDPVIQNVKGPADMGWDSKRNRLLVPRMMDDVVELYDLK
jgi:sugar lactone lactonase YvrE